MIETIPSSLTVILGAGQAAVLALVFIFGLMIRNRVYETKEQIMAEVRREFVPAQVGAQQFGSLNLLLQNLGSDVKDVSKRLANIEGRLTKGEPK